MCVCVFLGKIAVGSGMLQKLYMNVYMWPVLVEDISLQTGKSNTAERRNPEKVLDNQVHPSLSHP